MCWISKFLKVANNSDLIGCHSTLAHSAQPRNVATDPLVCPALHDCSGQSIKRVFANSRSDQCYVIKILWCIHQSVGHFHFFCVKLGHWYGDHMATIQWHEPDHLSHVYGLLHCEISGMFFVTKIHGICPGPLIVVGDHFQDYPGMLKPAMCNAAKGIAGWLLLFFHGPDQLNP